MCWAPVVQQTIVAAEWSTQHLWGCNAEQTLHSPWPLESPCNTRIRALQIAGAPSSLPLLNPLRLPHLAPPWYSTQVLSHDKGKASPGFYFNVLCWECSMTESQMRWGLEFLLGEQQLGNLIPLRSCPLARFISALSTSQAVPGFLLCCVCAVICTRETSPWTNPAKQPGGSRGVLSLDFISGHLLLSSLGIFPPLGIRKVCAWSTCLKITSVGLWFGLGTSLESFPNTEKTQNPKISLLSHSVSGKSTSWQSATVQCQPWDMSGHPKQWSLLGIIDLAVLWRSCSIAASPRPKHWENYPWLHFSV